jgi:hypothetical protein
MPEKPAAERLQVKGRRRLAVINAPKAVDSRIAAHKPRADANTADVVLLFVRNRAELDWELPRARASLTSAAIFWLAYPKLTSALAADLNRDIIAGLAPQHGLETVAQNRNRRRLVSPAPEANLLIWGMDNLHSGKFAQRRSW